MKRTLLIGLLILRILPSLVVLGADDVTGDVTSGAMDTLEPGEEYIWRMEDQKELNSFDSDRSGTVFLLDREFVMEGRSSCKLIPGGADETKMAVKITKILDKWMGKSALFVNLYLPEDHPMNGCFLGMASLTPDWTWIDGCMASTAIEPGQWNKVVFKLTDKMKFVKKRRQYAIYLCFWNEEAGVKVPIKKTDPFYIDGIGLAQ